MLFYSRQMERLDGRFNSLVFLFLDRTQLFLKMGIVCKSDQVFSFHTSRILEKKDNNKAVVKKYYYLSSDCNGMFTTFQYCKTISGKIIHSKVSHIFDIGIPSEMPDLPRKHQRSTSYTQIQRNTLYSILRLSPFRLQSNFLQYEHISDDKNISSLPSEICSYCKKLLLVSKHVLSNNRKGSSFIYIGMPQPSFINV